MLADGLTISSGGGAPEPLKLRLADGGCIIRAKLGDEDSEAELMYVAVMPRSGTPGTLVVNPFMGTPNPGNSATSVTGFAGRSGGSNGSLNFMGLAPGDYTVIAWRSSQEVEYRNPVVLAAISSYGVSVSLGDGESKEVTFKLIPKGVN